ncbi:hypothetical protein FH608_016365 [Nonomuraea phyllanthi]|uniref:Uncharacterized protein n=1 Tax=Nonomuraea phyllanthi TaxID=2219224 RepID=A0A5C4WL81_9ACTN|nr:hypothetical protein [Nonomuraea phyllanthi]KAB8194746.1 hypothetical protein FH608_016365 [Nonomuraea phyllanthi]
MDIEQNSTITKPGQTTSFLTPAPQPKAETRGDLENRIDSLSNGITSRHEKGSEAYEYASQLLDLAKMARSSMKEFPNSQLTLMANIIHHQPARTLEEADQDIGTLTKAVRDYLIMTRPPLEPYVLQRQEKADDESSRAVDAIARLKERLSILDGDGFDVDGIRANINDLSKEFGEKTKPDAWAKLQGYIFQLNETLAARSNYLLKDFEKPSKGPISNKTRYVDSIELIFTNTNPEPIPCFCEYKAYSTKQKSDAKIQKSFQEQLDDYVAMVSQAAQPYHLRYAFPGATPDWVFAKLQAAAEKLEAVGKRLYLTEGGKTRVVRKQKNYFTTSTAPSSDILTGDTPSKPSRVNETPGTANNTKNDTKNDTENTATVQPLKRTMSTPTPVVKKEKKKSLTKSTKKPELKVERGPLDAFFKTAKVHTPASTPQPGGRPNSTSNPGSTFK